MSLKDDAIVILLLSVSCSATSFMYIKTNMNIIKSSAEGLFLCMLSKLIKNLSDIEEGIPGL
jgi:hypothetical protein